MRIGIFTTVHIRHKASLGSLRLLIDSIRAHVARSDYETLMIVDDCSPEMPELVAYYDWLESSGIARIYRLGSSGAHHYWDEAPEGTRKSFGHAVGVMAGFHALREAGCTHAWVIDGDCVLLAPRLLDDVKRLFDYDKVAVVTDYFCGIPQPHTVQLASLVHHETIRGDERVVQDKSLRACTDAPMMYGFPTLFCGVVDLRVEELFGTMFNLGWINSKWGHRLFLRGFKTAYYPFFQHKFVFHLGWGYSRFNAKKRSDVDFGNLAKTGWYGSKQRGFHHAGYLQVNRPMEQHVDWLSWVSTEPFDQIKQYEKSWFTEPPKFDGPQVSREEGYLRPLCPNDVDRLSEFDSSNEATRFMQWDVHGRKQTEKFIQHAMQHPRRFFAFAAGEDGNLVGFGELHPLPDNDVATAHNILPRFQGRGYGAKLLNMLIQMAYQMDYRDIVCKIDEDNVACLKSFKKARASDYDNWQLTEEQYVLKGSARTRKVFRRGLGVPNRPPESLEEAHRQRERHLFDELGIRRP